MNSSVHLSSPLNACWLTHTQTQNEERERKV
jgi:hypothetical protein